MLRTRNVLLAVVNEVEAKLRYEDREAVADHVNRAICSATRSRTNAVRVCARSLLERTGFLLHFVHNCKAEAKQVSIIYYNRAKFNSRYDR